MPRSGNRARCLTFKPVELITPHLFESTQTLRFSHFSQFSTKLHLRGNNKMAGGVNTGAEEDRKWENSFYSFSEVDRHLKSTIFWSSAYFWTIVKWFRSCWRSGKVRVTHSAQLALQQRRPVASVQLPITLLLSWLMGKHEQISHKQGNNLSCETFLTSSWACYG